MTGRTTRERSADGAPGDGAAGVGDDPSDAGDAAGPDGAGGDAGDRDGAGAGGSGDGDEFPGISNPETGVTIRPAGSPAETDGAYAEATVELAPGASGPPEHVHPDTEERFAVRAGRVRMSVGGRERTLSTGDSVRVSPGTPHAFGNAGDGTARLRVRTVPPGELGAVLATLFGLAHDGRTDAAGRPHPLQAAVMAEELLDEAYFTGVPPAVQRAVGATLAPVGRALGYRARYDRYLDAAFWRDRVDGRPDDQR